MEVQRLQRTQSDRSNRVDLPTEGQIYLIVHYFVPLPVKASTCKASDPLADHV
jgi:hypothetical protein